MRSLLKTALMFCRDMDKRALPPYQTFLNQEKKYLDKKYMTIREAQGHESYGMRQLRYMLNFVDMNFLLGDINNYDRYLAHLRFSYDGLIFGLDQSQTGKPLYGTYIGTPNNNLTKEYIFPVCDVDTITRLPLEYEDWVHWRHIKPLRLWSHNSYELTTQLTNTAILFTEDYPSYAVFTIDPMALILKYVMWRKYQQANEIASDLAEHAPDQFFLHKYVFAPLIYDLGDIWLLKQLTRVLQIEHRDELLSFNVNQLQVNPQYGYIAGNCRQGFEYMWSSLVVPGSKTIRPETILSSRLLFSGSINDRMFYTENQLTLPMILRWDWCRVLRDYDTVMLFLLIWSMRKDLPTASRIITRMKLDIDNMYREQISSYCNNLELRLDIEQKIKEIEIAVNNLSKR